MSKVRILRALFPFFILAQVYNVHAQEAGALEVRLEKSHMVPMRDGIRLSIDLYFPQNAGKKLPVILVRTPYNKKKWRDREQRAVAYMFASQGFVVAVQDTRGKYESEGVFIPAGGDAEDGYDTVDWLAKQSWCNGKIGTYGCSYPGEVQIYQAPLRHPNLTAMIPKASGGAVDAANVLWCWKDVAFDFARSIQWIFRAGCKYSFKPPPGLSDSEILKIREFFEPSPIYLPEVDFEELYWSLPTVDIMEKAGAPPTDWVDLVSRDFDDPWWDQFPYLSGTEKIDVPALFINSWYDPSVEEELFLFNYFQQNAISETARNNQFVIISPTEHCSCEQATKHTIVGARDVGDARLDYWDIYLKWFDYWLKGKENGITNMPKVQYYVMGRNEWRSAEVWPLPETHFTKYYLHSDGDANTRNGKGQLSTEVPEDEPSDTFIYDPGNPVPSIGGATVQPRGARDQAKVEIRNDVLVYSTPVLEKGIEITGPIKAVLYVSSTAKDTDFTAKLVDVYPDGTAYNIQEGILRARYREGFNKKVWMKKGEVYEIHINLNATSNYFKRGHKIRLQVSSSSFPQYDRNLNTGGNNYDETEWVVAENTIHHSRKFPSHIILPIILENKD